MHGYSLGPVEEQNRKKVNRILIVLSIILTPLINKSLVFLIGLVRNVPHGETAVDWLINVGVTMSISYVMTYAALFFLVDKFLWASVLSKVLAIPNVQGVWKGTLQSNYNGGKKIDMTLIIKQTMTEISCVAKFEDSSSSSEMAKIVWINGDEIKLTFTFENKSRNVNVNQKEYYGYNWFLIRENAMRGWYFTNRQLSDTNTTNGAMILSREPKKRGRYKSSKSRHRNNS